MTAKAKEMCTQMAAATQQDVAWIVISSRVLMATISVKGDYDFGTEELGGAEQRSLNGIIVLRTMWTAT